MAKPHSNHDEHDDHAAPAKAARPRPTLRPSAPLFPHDGEDPSWWVPHAVLGTIVLVGVFGFFGAFNRWLKPVFHKDGAASATAAASASAAPAAPKPPAERPQADPSIPTYGAKHLVVQYKGATRSQQERTKDEAKARAEEALKKVQGGAKFEDVVGEFSDEPNAARTGGNLGRFRKGAMDPAFTAAVEKLKVGETSGVVESAFGYHVIVRTE